MLPENRFHAFLADYLSPRILSIIGLTLLCGMGFSPNPFHTSRVDADEKFPAELTRFIPSPRNPLFTGAGPGHWDLKIRERGWILRDGDQWKLWYTGYDGTREGVKLLGYATSPDGFTWTRHPDNPLDKQHWIEDVCVVKHDHRYVMVAEGVRDRAQLLISPDGLHWERQGTLDIRHRNGEPIEDGPFGTPTLFRHRDLWHLFYERRDAGIWLATSTDLKRWNLVQDEPIITPGPQEFDRDLIALNQIIAHKGRFYAVLHGARNDLTPKLWATGLATSTDLIHWEKYAGNPLLPIAANKSSGLLMPDGQTFRLYTMHDKVDVHLPAE